MSNGKGDSPRPYSVSPEQFEANYNAIFRKAPKAKATKAVQRGPVDGGKIPLLHHVGPAPRTVASKVRVNRQRLRKGRD